MPKDIFYFDSHVEDESINARVYGSDNGVNDLIFKGFILDDTHQVRIRNNWGKQNDFITRIQERGTEVANNFANTGRALDRITNNYVSKKFGKAGDTLNSHYISASNFYKSFQGTDIAYPELQVSLFLICDTSSFDIIGKFTTILKRFVGDTTSSTTTGKLTGYTPAPNKFRMPAGFDSDIPGSYLIRTNAVSYSNLLCSDIVYDISKQRIQESNKPLYITATFTFIPGSLITLKKLITNHIK